MRVLGLRSESLEHSFKGRAFGQRLENGLKWDSSNTLSGKGPCQVSGMTLG